MKISGGGVSDKQERGGAKQRRARERMNGRISGKGKSETAVCAVNNTSEINKARHALVFRSSPTSTATRANDSAGQFVQVFQIM